MSQTESRRAVRLHEFAKSCGMRIALIVSLASLLRGETNVDRAKPIVIAHRGASGYLPEHTEGAKILAIAQGADFV